MVTIEIIATGEKIDVTDQKITYVKQVSEIGDVTKLNSSYSWSMKFPKTPNNTRAFDDLGVVNSTSDFPYRKNYVNVYDKGIVIASNALLNVKETAEDYKAYVQEGIIDFIKSLSNDKIGEVIDLSDLDHRNDAATIIDSFTKDTYRYIIASYNGKPLANIGGITNLSADSLIPSINCKFLFDKIMDYYGWTYTGDLDIDGLWMTYPNATSYEDVGNEVLGLTTIDGRANGYESYDPRRVQSLPFINKDITLGKFEYVEGSQDCKFRCLSSGNYRITFNSKGYVKTPRRYEAYEPYLIINGSISIIGSKSSDLTQTTFETPLGIGDTIQLKIFSNTNNWLDAMIDAAVIEELNLSIYELGVQDISFSKALIKYKVKDFFKEMMIRGALTSFTDTDLKNIDFINLDNRLSATPIDFSDKFVSRKKESYLYESYAQNNYFKHNYDNEEDDYDDGNLKVDNENLEIEKELYKGKSFAPLQELVPFDGMNGQYFVNNFKMFEVEVKEDPDTGELFADYKALKNRFYFMETETRTDRIYIQGVQVNSFPVAKINKVSYRDIVSNKYSQINQLIERTKIHDIDLALSSFDVATLDLKKVYFFEQEHAYYLLNNVRYVSEELSMGEFILISRR